MRALVFTYVVIATGTAAWAATAKPVPLPVWFEATPGGGYVTRQSGAQLRFRPGELQWQFGGHRPLLATFANAQPHRRPVGEEPMEASAHYLTATRQDQNLPLYQRVRYAEVYPGGDLVFPGRQLQPEFDFEVAPGVNPAQIRLKFSGHRRMRIEKGGSLAIDVDGGEVNWHRPSMVQGSRRWEGRFR